MPSKSTKPASPRKSRKPSPTKKSSAAAPRRKAASAASARPYVVRRSPVHGRGVFATRTIPKGEDIVEYRGQVITMKQADRRPDSDPDNPYHTFLFELDDGRVIDAAVRGNAARWINHSCEPNCEPYEDDDNRREAHHPQGRGARLRLPAQRRRPHHQGHARGLHVPLRVAPLPRHDAPQEALIERMGPRPSRPRRSPRRRRAPTRG